MLNFKDSNELLDYAVRQVEETLNNGEREVKILLGEFDKGKDSDPVQISEYCEIDTITEMLREKFENNQIKSGVESKCQEPQKKHSKIHVTWIINF